MKKIYFPLATICLLAFFTTGQAAPGDVNVGVKGGTLGIGLEAGVDLSDTFALRGGINYLKFDFDSTISNIDYNFEPQFFNGSLLLDWHPFTNSFRLTAGAYINDNEMKMEGTYRKDRIPSGYDQYSGLTDMVKVKGTADFNTVAPYVGLGWTSNQGDSGWGVNLDLGVMFQGAPNVSELYIDGPLEIGSHPVVKRFLDDERKAIEDDLDNFQYYPVASISINYKF